ncbi:hypothetical protein B0H17DRAFT_987778 [Mycena rosella]|uniref:F-box domain-containing protein n=1 Tax=Mycena rosella TaxID=1033263 RepID=A0AAD7D2K1_MYCRO|nr:hypothetical protein B0H17DRAFT_987778 [Mycena rosella]
MVSADNVNLDVLEHIFTYLAGNDLPSVALVSRSFFAGVIPRLYRTLLFRLSHAKRYPALMSPFSAIAAHPEFAIHVRHVDIRTVPVVKTQCNPRFLLECARAIALCSNITSFRCSISNALPPFLAALQQTDRLQRLRISAALTTEQATRVVALSTIRHLTLDFASWNLMDLLPRWTAVLQNNLTTLTLYMAHELNETVLESALASLPGLLGLHVIGCPKVDHASLLALVTHTPNLESLSMTTGDPARPLPTPPNLLPHLHTLALDTRLPAAPFPAPAPAPAAILAILAHLASSLPPPRLAALALKLPAAPPALIAQLIAAHGPTLRRVALLDCALGTDSLAALSRACVRLERLEVRVPVRDLTPFAHALAPARTLRTLVDATPRTGPALAQTGVRHLFARIPSLMTVVTGGRVWTRRTGLSIALERHPPHGAGVHWFMPRE